MNIRENVSLTGYSTMRLGGPARWLAEATTSAEVKDLVAWASENNHPCLMIGQGSNIVWRDEGYPGLVIVNKIAGREVINKDGSNVIVKLGGGEAWDEVVGRTVDNGWSGIEFLSLIPGTVGAAPVQNIGAYGAEIADSLVEVKVFDTQTMSFDSLNRGACAFSYRSSRFKTTDKARFMILEVVLCLNTNNPKPPFYETLAKYFKQNNITEFSPKAVREAVISIRNSKLPDPKKIANNGSFFTNPIIEKSRFEDLKKQYVDIKGWEVEGQKVKLAAGWLVEKAGFKGVHDQQTGMATWPAQALVLVNEHAKHTADLLKFRQKITDKVQELFGIALEQEPELLP